MDRPTAAQAFDSLLRGRVSADDRVRLLRLWLLVQVVAAALFGVSLGVYAVTSRADPDFRFMASSAIKMPLLLLLTTVVTCPSLYVFGALRGLRFTATQFVAMLLTGHTIFAGVLASFATVLAFFGLTTNSYSFMVLLTVGTCALAGFLGLVAFVRALRKEQPPESRAPEATALESEVRVEDDSVPEAGEAAEEESLATAGGPTVRPRRMPPPPRPAEENNIWQVLGWWLVLYGFVGVQMSWILRPFIGSPDLEWVFLRGRSGGFVESVLQHLGEMFSG